MEEAVGAFAQAVEVALQCELVIMCILAQFVEVPGARKSAPKPVISDYEPYILIKIQAPGEETVEGKVEVDNEIFNDDPVAKAFISNEELDYMFYRTKSGALWQFVKVPRKA